MCYRPPPAAPGKGTSSRAYARSSLRSDVFGLQLGGVSASGRGGDDRGAVLARVGAFGEAEDVPGDIGAGDGLHGEAVAGLDVPGERAVGQFDRKAAASRSRGGSTRR